MMLNDEQLSSISGGYTVDDLSAEDRAEIEKWTNIYLDEKLKNIKSDPAFNQDRLDEAMNMLTEINERFKLTYGK